MKLFRYGALGAEKPGLVDDAGILRDLSHYLTDLDPVTLQDPLLFQSLHALSPQHLPQVSPNVRIGAPISKPGKVICVGLNSAMHAEELGLKVLKKKELLIFLKPSSSISGPNDPILYTRLMKKLDWEAELAIVIGKQGKYIPLENAKEYIFGYTCMNDLSERHLQFETEDNQFTKGKCFDGAAALGPYLVTKNEVSDITKLAIHLWVNGENRQAFHGADYMHDDASVVSYVSQFFTLYPGDVISMGSGPGNALSYGEQFFLKPGDRVTFRIEGLGQQDQLVIRE